MALGDPGTKQGPPGRSLCQPPQARIYRSLPSAAEASRGQPSPTRSSSHHPLASMEARASSPSVREEELLQQWFLGARFANAEPSRGLGARPRTPGPVSLPGELDADPPYSPPQSSRVLQRQCARWATGTGLKAEHLLLSYQPSLHREMG